MLQLDDGHYTDHGIGTMRKVVMKKIVTRKILMREKVKIYSEKLIKDQIFISVVRNLSIGTVLYSDRQKPRI